MSENGMEAYVKYNYFHMEQRPRFKPDPFKLFPYDERMGTYLKATGREEVAKMAASVAADLRADDEVLANPEKYYAHVFAFAFQIDDFADSDERDLVVGFDREVLLVAGRGLRAVSYTHLSIVKPSLINATFSCLLPRVEISISNRIFTILLDFSSI